MSGNSVGVVTYWWTAQPVQPEAMEIAKSKSQGETGDASRLWSMQLDGWADIVRPDPHNSYRSFYQPQEHSRANDNKSSCCASKITNSLILLPPR
jgi:hypothetical protein